VRSASSRVSNHEPIPFPILRTPVKGGLLGMRSVFVAVMRLEMVMRQIDLGRVDRGCWYISRRAFAETFPSHPSHRGAFSAAALRCWRGFWPSA